MVQCAAVPNQHLLPIFALDDVTVLVFLGTPFALLEVLALRVRLDQPIGRMGMLYVSLVRMHSGSITKWPLISSRVLISIMPFVGVIKYSMREGRLVALHVRIPSDYTSSDIHSGKLISDLSSSSSSGKIRGYRETSACKDSSGAGVLTKHLEHSNEIIRRAPAPFPLTDYVPDVPGNAEP